MRYQGKIISLAIRVSPVLRVSINSSMRLAFVPLRLLTLKVVQITGAGHKGMQMKARICIFTCTLLFVFFPVSIATPQIIQDVPISSPNPLGSGARALGMGGAFIAVADDATAASWNPGGLMQLETPEVSMVLYNASRTEDYTFFEHPEADGSERVNEFNLNYFSAAYPFAVFGKNMIVSLNYQRLYDVDKELNYNYHISQTLTPPPGLPPFTIDITKKDNYIAEGGIKAISPAYAIQITESLSLGFTLNYWTDALGGRNGWKDEFRAQYAGSIGVDPISGTYISSNDYDNFRGFNYNLGVLWNITEMITVGAVFKSEFESKMRHTFTSKYDRGFCRQDYNI